MFLVRSERVKEKEIEARMREKELELKMKEIELQASQRSHESEKFDVSRNIRLVPPFKDTEIDKYFLHFEKVAVSLHWPKEVWTLLLQSVLSGKAQEIYSSLSVDQGHIYEDVKKAILNGYELVPEAYRQKFRNSKKHDSQTYVEFARDKEMLFDKWCTSLKVDNFEI